MFNLRFTSALILVVALVGCQTPTPAARWKVTAIRPDGKAHKSWVVSSPQHPVAYLCLGGQIVLHRDNGGGGFIGRYESLDLIAPVGWAFECERVVARDNQ